MRHSVSKKVWVREYHKGCRNVGFSGCYICWSRHFQLFCILILVNCMNMIKALQLEDRHTSLGHVCLTGPWFCRTSFGCFDIHLGMLSVKRLQLWCVFLDLIHPFIGDEDVLMLSSMIFSSLNWIAISSDCFMLCCCCFLGVKCWIQKSCKRNDKCEVWVQQTAKQQQWWERSLVATGVGATALTVCNCSESFLRSTSCLLTCLTAH